MTKQDPGRIAGILPIKAFWSLRHLPDLAQPSLWDFHLTIDGGLIAVVKGLIKIWEKEIVPVSRRKSTELYFLLRKNLNKAAYPLTFTAHSIKHTAP